MRATLVAVLVANAVVASYALFSSPAGNEAGDARAREVAAEKVTILRAGSAPENPATAAAPIAAASGTPAPPASPIACLEWGAFSPGELTRAQAALGGLEPGRSFVREQGLGPAWWVYVPPLGSREEAEQRALEIRQGGVQGARVVNETDRWRNAIALGLFKTEEAAAALAARVRASQAPNAAVVQRNNLLRLASIVIVEPPPALVARLAELQATFAGTALKAIACPTG
jgi:hypothetical protein